MDFETFRENLARDIEETLEARTGTDFEVEHRTAEKMNGNYEAIVVKFSRKINVACNRKVHKFFTYTKIIIMLKWLS